MSPEKRTARVRLVLSGVLLALGACQSEQARTPAPPPPPEKRRAEISNEFMATAEVVAVVPAERLVTLRREDGTQFEVQVDSAVRNFEQVAVGDALRVRYKETLAAELRPAGEARQPGTGAIAAARAKPGAKPGAGLGFAASVQVKIESLDLEHDIAVFSLASGELLARRVRTPQGLEFIRGLKIGDVVQLDYAEAVALSVEKL